MMITIPFRALAGHFRGLLATSIVLAFALAANAQTTITLRADSWYPYNCDPAAPQPGYGIEIIRAVFEKAGCKVDYELMPWKRAVSEVSAGKITAIIGAQHSDAPDCIFPDEPIGQNLNHFFVKKNSAWKFKGLDSLKHTRLGVIQGYSYNDSMDAYIRQNEKNSDTVDEASGDTAVIQSINKLKAGRIDAYLENHVVFWANLAKQGLNPDDFESAGQLGEAEPLYIAFSPKLENSKQLADKFSQGLRELRKSGELATILAKYKVKDWNH